MVEKNEKLTAIHFIKLETKIDYTLQLKNTYDLLILSRNSKKYNKFFL